jgi:hypothetical protein
MKSGSNLLNKRYRQALDAKKRCKEGRSISSSNAAKIQDHIDTVHEHAKGLRNAANDLATILQGSEGAYGTDYGTPDYGQEGSKSRYGRYASSSFGYEVKALDERVTVQREQKASTIPSDVREWDFRSFARAVERKMAR